MSKNKKRILRAFIVLAVPLAAFVAGHCLMVYIPASSACSG